MSWTVDPYICIESHCKATSELVRVHDEHGQPFGPFCQKHAETFMRDTDKARRARRKKK